MFLWDEEHNKSSGTDQNSGRLFPTSKTHHPKCTKITSLIKFYISFYKRNGSTANPWEAIKIGKQ